MHSTMQLLAGTQLATTRTQLHHRAAEQSSRGGVLRPRIPFLGGREGAHQLQLLRRLSTGAHDVGAHPASVMRTPLLRVTREVGDR